MNWQKLSIIFVTSILVAVVYSGTAGAADARNFNAGRIIDDAVFTNSDSMSVQQIQNFLNSKTTCDTYGRKKSELGGGTRAQWLASKGISVPITCLRDYHENPSNGANNYGKSIPAGAISAAQIIYNYSKQFNINPQVLIVTLQKENGLVTDEWPTPKQYTESMGFGCPDNVAPGAPACDPTYGSFSAQIYQAARHFRGYINKTPGWWIPFNTGNNSVRWSPNASCGSSMVNIQNRSTVALYSYTPYQPNQAAKNAQYGTGDGCSAYGNRNFYMYFTDWFGTTVGVQDLLSDGSGIYYISNGYKYYVPNMEQLYNYGYTDADAARIIRTSTAELNKIPTGAGFSQVSVVVASEKQGIFLISNGYKYYVPAMNVLYNYGFKDSDIMLISDDSLNRFAQSNKSLGNFVSDINGYAYRVENGKRRAIYQPWVLNQYPDANTSNWLSWAVLDKIQIGSPITKGRLAFVAGATTYVAIDGKWFTVRDKEVSTCVGVEGVVPIEPYRTVADTPVGHVDSCFVSDENNEKYLMDGAVKYAIDNNIEIQYSSVKSGDNIANMTTIPYSQHKNILATQNGIYTLQGGKVRHIMQMAYVQDVLGSGKVSNLNTDSLRYLPKGANIYSDHSLIAGSSRGIHIVIDDNMYYIGSMDQFYSYGFRINNIANVGDADIDRQAYAGLLPGAKVKCGGDYFLMSNGTKYSVSAESITSYGGANSFTDVNCKIIAKNNQASMTRFIATPGNKNIYYIDAGAKRHILSWQTFLDLGGHSNDVITVDDYVFGAFPAGVNI